MASKALLRIEVKRQSKTAPRLVGLALLGMSAAPSVAATFGPPMLDITSQCSANSRRNVTAMSECIVAESEARAEILQKWHKVSDANAERCVKLGRKGQKFPYMKIAECLSAAPVPVAPAATTPPSRTAPAKPAPAKTAPAASRR